MTFLQQIASRGCVHRSAWTLRHRSGALLRRVRRILGVSFPDRGGEGGWRAGIVTLVVSLALAGILPFRASGAANNADSAAENSADADRNPVAQPAKGRAAQTLAATIEGSFAPGEFRIQGTVNVPARTRSAQVYSLFLHPHIEDTRLCVGLQFTSQQVWGAKLDVTLWDAAGNVVAKCSHTEDVGPEKLYSERLPLDTVRRWNAFRAIWLDLPKKAETARRFRVELQELKESPPRNAQQWGEPVDGMSARLRPVKDRWKVGETPEFLADVRNLGRLELFVTQAQQVCELNGRAYRWNGEADVKSLALGPGRERHGIRIKLSDSWRRVKDPAPLTLAPGWHRLRVTFIAVRRDSDGGGDVRSQSNAVEFRVEPTSPRAAASESASKGDPSLTARLADGDGTPPDNRKEVRELITQERWDEVKKLAPIAVRTQYGANMADGTLAIGKPILLDWDVCVRKGAEAARGDEQRPLIYRYPWVEFMEVAGGLTAAIHLQYESWPHCSWMLRGEVLDQAGRKVSDAWAVHENSGTIEKYPSVEKQTVALHLGPKAAKEGKTFRCSIETVWVEQGGRFQFGQQTPLSLSLTSAESSRMFLARWLTLEKLDGDVRATVHVRMLSWPKSGWRLSLNLFDEKGQQAGHVTAATENSGVVSSYPAIHEKDVRFNVKGASGLMQSARSYTLRVERTAATVDGRES